MIRRDGFVYSFYMKNVRNLALLTLAMGALSVYDEIRLGGQELLLLIPLTAVLVGFTACFLARPQWHPNYFQLKLYGPPEQIAAQIDAQADAPEKTGWREYRAGGWTFRRGLFTTTIQKTRNE